MRAATLFAFLITLLSVNILSAQTRVWHVTDTTLLGTSASRIALDGSGNVLIGVQGVNAAMVIKWDSAGTQKWQAPFQSVNPITFYDMVADAAGNSYFCGTFTSNNGDAFIAKVSPLGTIQWSPTYDYQGHPDSYYALTIDKDGNIIAVGTSVDTNIVPQLLVVKYSPAGVITWSRHYNAPNFTYNGDKVVTDAAGNIYVACDRIGNTSGYDFDVVKFDGTGAFQWEQTINSAAAYNDLPNAMAIDNAGNVYMVGYSDSMNSGRFGFIAKVDASGSARWSKIMHYNTTLSELYGCTVDGNGNFYVCGLDSNKAYVAKIDTATGDTSWAFHYTDTSGVTNGSTVAMVFKNNSLYATGQVADNQGNQSAITMKLSSDGHLLYSDKYSGIANGPNSGASIVVGNDGNFYVGAGTIEVNGVQTSPSVLRYYETPTGIFELPANAPFTVSAYPDPTDRELQFTVNMTTAGHAIMYVYDLAGQQIATVFDRQMDAGKNTAVWNASLLTKGTYLYEMVTPAGKTSGKFVKY